jgi:hypothetical protein
MTLFSETILIFISGLMPNLIKKSWTVSNNGAYSILSELSLFRKNILEEDEIFAHYLIVYTQSPIIRTGRIRTDAEFLGKFKNRALGSSNLRTTSKNLRTTSAQIYKAKNQELLPCQRALLYLHFSIRL